MKGSTKTMASASAIGITCTPETKAIGRGDEQHRPRQDQPGIPPAEPPGQPQESVTGTISVPCTKKRAAVIWPTGMGSAVKQLRGCRRKPLSWGLASVPVADVA
jgi:hypothetical protein